MDKRTKKLREQFPGTNNETRLVILGKAQRIKIGDELVQLKRYPVGNNEYIYAAYVEDTNVIYLRLIEL